MGDTVKNQFNQLIKSVTSEVVEGEVLGQLKYVSSSLNDSSRKVKESSDTIYRNNNDLKRQMSSELISIRKSMSDIEHQFGITDRNLDELQNSISFTVNRINQEIKRGFKQSEEEFHLLREEVYKSQNKKLVDKLSFSNSLLKAMIALNILTAGILAYLIWVLTQYI